MHTLLFKDFCINTLRKNCEILENGQRKIIYYRISVPLSRLTSAFIVLEPFQLYAVR